MNQMNRKFKYEQYQITANFKNETCFWVSAQFTPTQEIFLKDDVELIRIKKDTVFATLQRKSQKNLRCQLEQIIADGKKYLLITFIVNFDYLPEFKEEIKLDFVEKKDKLKSISVSNFQGEIEEMENILNSFKKNGLTIHQQQPSIVNFNAGQDIWEKSISRGKYLLRVSGIYTNSSGGVAGDLVTFKIKIPGGEEKKTLCSAFSQHGYSYPINFSELIEADDGDLKINASSSVAACSLTNTHFTLNPVFQMA